MGGWTGIGKDRIQWKGQIEITEPLPAKDSDLITKFYSDSQDFWQRVGTTLSPKTSTDTVTFGVEKSVATDVKFYGDGTHASAVRLEFDGVGNSLTMRWVENDSGHTAGEFLAGTGAMQFTASDGRFLQLITGTNAPIQLKQNNILALDLDTSNNADFQARNILSEGKVILTNGADEVKLGDPNVLGKFSDGSKGIKISDAVNALDITGNTISDGTYTQVKIKLTALGGYAILLTNKTGANSVQGEIVRTDAGNDDSVILATSAETNPIGVFLESGISDGSEAWIVVSGIADVLADTAGFTRGDRLVTSLAAATVGRATANNAPAVAVHFQEIGHAIETAAANALGRAVIHFL